MTVEPKLFSIRMEADLAQAVYCTEFGTINPHITQSLWKPSEGMPEFKRDYCFQMTSTVVEGTTSENGNNPDFEAAIFQVADQTGRERIREISLQYVPVSLLIGKKPGDSLYLRDGTQVRLNSCEHFERLHQQIARAKTHPDDADLNPHSRLDEISTKLNTWLKPISAKVFEAVIYPRRGDSAEHFSKLPGAENSISGIVWRSDDAQEFEEEFCFRVCLKQTQNLNHNLTQNSDFKKILESIGDYTGYDWIPARLLIGKKDGDHLTLKDGTIVKLICANFKSCFLEQQLKLARENYPDHIARLEALSAHVKSTYGEFKKEVEEKGDEVLEDLINATKPGCLQQCVSAITALFWGIAQFFVRLFTWNWNEA